MKMLVLIPLAAFALSTFLLIPSLAHAEVAGCNADGVKNAVMMGQRKKILDAAGTLIVNPPPGSPAASLQGELNRWEMKIENVRQTGYDAVNNIRYCAAELLHTNYPEMAAMTFAVGANVKPPCRGNIIYKIEFLLDKNTDWITSGCRD